MKNNKVLTIVLICICSIFTILLSIFLVVSIKDKNKFTFNFDFLKKGESNNLIYNESFDLCKFRIISTIYTIIFFYLLFYKKYCKIFI